MNRSDRQRQVRMRGNGSTVREFHLVLMPCTAGYEAPLIWSAACTRADSIQKAEQGLNLKWDDMKEAGFSCVPFSLVYNYSDRWVALPGTRMQRPKTNATAGEKADLCNQLAIAMNAQEHRTPEQVETELERRDKAEPNQV